MTTRRGFARAALALGAAAPLVGSPFASGSLPLHAEELARAVEQGEDHVEALDLAEWIRQGRAGLRVIDLRSRADYDVGHIASAVSMSITDVVTEPVAPESTLVLYSEGGAHAGQAWVLLRARGLRQVYFLRSGADEWAERVLYPAIATDATPAERAEYARAVELCAYYGGKPRGPLPRAALSQARASLRRRGC